MKWTWFMALVVITVYFFLSGCGGSSQGAFGAPISGYPVISAGLLFDHPDGYDGKIVTLQGVIDLQDRNGTWFYFADDDARIYVDLTGAGFRIPDLTGKSIKVEGRVAVAEQVPAIMGHGIELL